MSWFFLLLLSYTVWGWKEIDETNEKGWKKRRKTESGWCRIFQLWPQRNEGTEVKILTEYLECKWFLKIVIKSKLMQADLCKVTLNDFFCTPSLVE